MATAKTGVEGVPAKISNGDKHMAKGPYADYTADMAGVGDGPVSGATIVSSEGKLSCLVATWGNVAGVS